MIGKIPSICQYAELLNVGNCTVYLYLDWIIIELEYKINWNAITMEKEGYSVSIIFICFESDFEGSQLRYMKENRQ